MKLHFELGILMCVSQDTPRVVGKIKSTCMKSRHQLAYVYGIPYTSLLHCKPKTWLFAYKVALWMQSMQIYLKLCIDRIKHGNLLASQKCDCLPIRLHYECDQCKFTWICASAASNMGSYKSLNTSRMLGL